jgi:hypothetical protein
MKTQPLLVAISLLAMATSAKAQSFAGYRTSNYTGVNSVFFNPANAADSRHKFDVNLIAAAQGVYNNTASFKLDDVLNNFDTDALLDQFLNSANTSGLIPIDLHGPSFMFGLGAKSSIAITTRVQGLVNIAEVNGTLLNEITNGDAEITLPYTFNQTGKNQIAAHGWGEIGATYARVLSPLDSRHFFKVGLTAKYLMGAGSAYVNFSNVSGTLSQDLTEKEYLSNTTGSIAFGAGGISFDDFEPTNLISNESSGFGADFGVIYELRRKPTTESLGNLNPRSQNKYLLKLGISLQNLGSITYNRDLERSAGYTASITGNERFYTQQLQDADGLKEVKNLLDNNPASFTPVANANTSSYKVTLPTTANVDIDYALGKNFYLNGALQLPLTSNSIVWNGYQYFYATVTPRFETRLFDLSLPVTYHNITGFNAGLALRLGPVFLGSGSLITALASQSKQADVFIGLHIGGLFNKYSKVKADAVPAATN